MKIPPAAWDSIRSFPFRLERQHRLGRLQAHRTPFTHIDPVKDDHADRQVRGDGQGEPRSQAQVTLNFDFAGDFRSCGPVYGEGRRDQTGQGIPPKLSSSITRPRKKKSSWRMGPGNALFVASPNGQYLSLSLGDAFGPGTETPLILVISNKGQLHSKIAVE